MIVGVLALQGAFAKHISILRSMNVEAVEVRYTEQLQQCDRLIIPGGESTTLMKQIERNLFVEPLRQFGDEKPVFGTCAGLILMATRVVGDPFSPFSLLDIEVERNGYGRQVDSFKKDIFIDKVSLPGIFIRAPKIQSVGPKVQILAEDEGRPVLVRQGKHLAATFHPELTPEHKIHQMFLEFEFLRSLVVF